MFYVCSRCGKATRGRRLCKNCWAWQKRRKAGIPPVKIIRGESISIRLPKPILEAIRHEAKAKNVYVADVVRNYLSKIYGEF